MIIVKIIKHFVFLVVVTAFVSLSALWLIVMLSDFVSDGGESDTRSMVIEQLPSEGQCKLAEYMLNNSRYYTASNLRKADEINKQCKEIDNDQKR